MYACVFACIYIFHTNTSKSAVCCLLVSKLKHFQHLGKRFLWNFFWNLMNTLEQVNKFALLQKICYRTMHYLNFLVIDILSILLSKPRCYILVVITLCMLNNCYRIFIAFIIAYFILPFNKFQKFTCSSSRSWAKHRILLES